MRDKFTKSDLKDGMVVEIRDGDKYLVLGDRVVRKEGFNRLEEYADDLTECKFHYENFDIIRVFKAKNDCIYNLKSLFENENLNIIWERKETKRMTAEEMIGKLKLYCDGRSCAKCVLSSMGSVCNYYKLEDSKLKQYYEKEMEDERARNENDDDDTVCVRRTSMGMGKLSHFHKKI